jgi:hypothetical protein
MVAARWRRLVDKGVPCDFAVAQPRMPIVFRLKL